MSYYFTHPETLDSHSLEVAVVWVKAGRPHSGKYHELIYTQSMEPTHTLILDLNYHYSAVRSRYM